MPEEPSSEPSRSRPHRPRLSELSRETTEEDLWDLDGDLEDSVETPASIEPAPRIEPALPAEPAAPAGPEPEPQPEPGSSPVPEEPDEAPEAEEEPEPSPPEIEELPVEPLPSAPPAAEPDDATPTADEESAADRDAEATDEDAPAPRSFSLPNRRDLVSLGLLAAVFLGLAIWWIAGQFSDIPTTRLGGDQPELPVAGQHVEVAEASTYWRKPVRSGESRDVTRAEVEHIPAVSVKITDGSGALRAIFRTHTGDFVGDSITRVFKNGRFVGNGSDTMEFPSTDGYETDGDMNGYRIGGDRWSVEFLEGPGPDASGREFKSLFTIPVSPARR